MYTTFYFNDGTVWEWKDQPVTAEDSDIIQKYFSNGFTLKHIDIAKVVMSLESLE
tara:strand:- start:5034 stop:5198 length:165 start_codon:yes stop_codon:yes gene_type:complete